MLLHRQLRWLGHVIRMPRSRLPNCVLYGQLKLGRRSVGGQKKRFKDHIKSILKRCNIPFSRQETLASERATCVLGMSYFDDEYDRTAALRRSRRHQHAPVLCPIPDSDYQCPLCGRQCYSHIGLLSYSKTHFQHWRGSRRHTQWMDSKRLDAIHRWQVNSIWKEDCTFLAVTSLFPVCTHTIWSYNETLRICWKRNNGLISLYFFHWDGCNQHVELVVVVSSSHQSPSWCVSRFRSAQSIAILLSVWLAPMGSRKRGGCHEANDHSRVNGSALSGRFSLCTDQGISCDRCAVVPV